MLHLPQHIPQHLCDQHSKIMMERKETKRQKWKKNNDKIKYIYNVFCSQTTTVQQSTVWEALRSMVSVHLMAITISMKEWSTSNTLDHLYRHNILPTHATHTHTSQHINNFTNACTVYGVRSQIQTTKCRTPAKYKWMKNMREQWTVNRIRYSNETNQIKVSKKRKKDTICARTIPWLYTPAVFKIHIFMKFLLILSVRWIQVSQQWVCSVQCECEYAIESSMFDINKGIEYWTIMFRIHSHKHTQEKIRCISTCWWQMTCWLLLIPNPNDDMRCLYKYIFILLKCNQKSSKGGFMQKRMNERTNEWRSITILKAFVLFVLLNVNR